MVEDLEVRAESSPLKVLLLFIEHSSSFTAYPWALARSGKLLVDAVSRSDHVVKHSSWVNEHYVFNDADDCIAVLKARLATQEYVALYCMGAPALELVTKYREDPILRPFLPYSGGSEMFEISEDKQLFQGWCHSLDIPVPQSRYANDASELFLSSDQLQYPSVLKFNKGYGGQEVFIIHSKQELEDTLAAHPPSADTSLILQDYIDGGVGTTIFVANQGQLYGCFSLENVRRLSRGLGPSVACRFVESQKLIDFAEKIAAESLVSGITGFDWVQSRDGQFYVIDPHLGRVTPNAIISHLIGMDLGEVAHSSLVGRQECQSQMVRNEKMIWLMPQVLEYVFQPKASIAKSEGTPSIGNTVFFGGQKELRLRLFQAAEYIFAQIRISLGRLRRQLTRCISGLFRS